MTLFVSLKKHINSIILYSTALWRILYYAALLCAITER